MRYQVLSITMPESVGADRQCIEVHIGNLECMKMPGCLPVFQAAKYRAEMHIQSSHIAA